MLKLFSRKSNKETENTTSEEFKIDVVEVPAPKVVHVKTSHEDIKYEADIKALDRINREINDFKLADDEPTVVINKLKGVQNAVDNLRYMMTLKSEPLSEENMKFAQEIRANFNREVRALILHTRVMILSESMTLKCGELEKYIDDIFWYTCPLIDARTNSAMAELRALV